MCFVSAMRNSSLCTKFDYAFIKYAMSWPGIVKNLTDHRFDIEKWLLALYFVKCILAFLWQTVCLCLRSHHTPYRFIKPWSVFTFIFQLQHHSKRQKTMWMALFIPVILSDLNSLCNLEQILLRTACISVSSGRVPVMDAHSLAEGGCCVEMVVNQFFSILSFQIMGLSKCFDGVLTNVQWAKENFTSSVLHIWPLLVLLYKILNVDCHMHSKETCPLYNKILLLLSTVDKIYKNKYKR